MKPLPDPRVGVSGWVDEVNEMLKQKENLDNRNGYQGSPLKSIGRSGDTELFTKTQ